MFYGFGEDFSVEHKLAQIDGVLDGGELSNRFVSCEAGQKT
jgi:hypothetical protein